MQEKSFLELKKRIVWYCEDGSTYEKLLGTEMYSNLLDELTKRGIQIQNQKSIRSLKCFKNQNHLKFIETINKNKEIELISSDMLILGNLVPHTGIFNH